MSAGNAGWGQGPYVPPPKPEYVPEGGDPKTHDWVFDPTTGQWSWMPRRPAAPPPEMPPPLREEPQPREGETPAIVPKAGDHWAPGWVDGEWVYDYNIDQWVWRDTEVPTLHPIEGIDPAIGYGNPNVHQVEAGFRNPLTEEEILSQQWNTNLNSGSGSVALSEFDKQAKLNRAVVRPDEAQKAYDAWLHAGMNGGLGGSSILDPEVLQMLESLGFRPSHQYGQPTFYRYSGGDRVKVYRDGQWTEVRMTPEEIADLGIHKGFNVVYEADRAGEDGLIPVIPSDDFLETGYQDPDTAPPRPEGVPDDYGWGTDNEGNYFWVPPDQLPPGWSGGPVTPGLDGEWMEPPSGTPVTPVPEDERVLHGLDGIDDVYDTIDPVMAAEEVVEPLSNPRVNPNNVAVIPEEDDELAPVTLSFGYQGAAPMPTRLQRAQRGAQIGY